jgi:hypothetical protein
MNQDDIALIKIAAATATAFAAVLTAFYVVIMRPLIGLLQGKILAEVKSEFTTLRSEMKLEFATVRTEMTAMEKRLNDRIDAYVIRH